MITRTRHNRSGQTIIEALVAISVLVIGLLGIISLTTRALSEERTVADNFRAAYLASEGIEIARNIIDANYNLGVPWNTGFVCVSTCHYALDYRSTSLVTLPSHPCVGVSDALYLDTNGFYSYNVAGTKTPFSRCITVSNDPVIPGAIDISSGVTWTERGAQTTMNIEARFFNWRPK